MLNTLSNDPNRFLFQKMVAVLPASPSAYASPDQLIPQLRAIGKEFGWLAEPKGAFGNMVPAGAKVLVKPNFVLHENNGPWSYDAVITHPSFVQSVVSELQLTDAAKISVGDSPVQNCDFTHLLRRTKLDIWSHELMTREPRFTGIRD